jgi:hypothetical protein
MARRPTPIATLFEPTCSREQALNERDMFREQDRQWEQCRKINTKPGYETLTKMKYKGGN